MSKFTFSLVLPCWLAQWYIHKCGGSLPVRLPKGSHESFLVQRLSVRKSEAIGVDIAAPGAIEIEIPDNKFKPADVYCCLPLRAKLTLIKSISEYFNLCIAEDLVTHLFPACLKKDLIEAWMENNGIEVNDTNYSGVEKRYRRLREKRLNSQRVKKHRKKCSE